MRKLDISGNHFGDLIAVEVVGTGAKRIWRCECSCGGTRDVPTFQLTSGNVRTCGDAKNHQDIRPGSRFGKLVVIKLERNTVTMRWFAICQCDCGQQRKTSVRNLQRGSSSHCGCSTDHANRGLPPGVAARNSLLSNYKSNARSKGLEFALTDEECDDLFQGNCSFCGQKPSESVKRKRIKGSDYKYNGIDRSDSSKGYTTDNVKSCCTACNYLKGARSDEEFLAHITRIYRYTDNLGEHST